MTEKKLPEWLEKARLREMEVEGLWANGHLKQNVEVDSLEVTGDLGIMFEILDVQQRADYDAFLKLDRPDVEAIDELRTKLSELEKKLDDREADLIEAKREGIIGVLEYIEDLFPELDAAYWKSSRWKQFKKEQALKEKE